MWTRFQLATTFDTSVQRGREVLAIGPEVAFPRGNDDIEPTD